MAVSLNCRFDRFESPMTNDRYCMALCTCPDQETGELIANALLDAELAACINIVPGLTSLYRWRGERQRGTEVLLMIKTRRSSYDALENRIQEMHPYELPEIIAVPIDAGFAPYLNWIDDCCAKNR